MIDPDDRLFASSGAIYPGGPSIWYIVDWDQRRFVSVTMDEELESEDPALEQPLKHIDDNSVRCSRNGARSDGLASRSLCTQMLPISWTGHPFLIRRFPKSGLTTKIRRR